ncbi:hypothetical protein D6D12_03974 [Aureobasidium pullulans]|uniref:Uncharacterized protein n=1 Tax=Aureobasidium pullulans TaxID=5580 RepID=A0AB74JW83_AURPU|nr:hypothetical protein D6D11_10671 [Aureobasidium pullulans]THX29760.1 hypothetical protein D6D12_03974 [Aureobasidium pullulans]
MMDYANQILENLYVAVPKYQKARVTTIFKERRWGAILWSWDNRVLKSTNESRDTAEGAMRFLLETTSEWVYGKTQKMRVELNE